MWELGNGDQFLPRVHIGRYEVRELDRSITVFIKTIQGKECGEVNCSDSGPKIHGCGRDVVEPWSCLGDPS